MLTPNTYFRHLNRFPDGSKLLHYTHNGQLVHVFPNGTRKDSEWTVEMVQMFTKHGSLIPVNRDSAFQG